MDYLSTPQRLYHFVNYQCKEDCGERYYPDESDPNFFFCRSCPSNCLNCDDARTCTNCIKDYYLTTDSGYTLCVQAKDCAAGSFPANLLDINGNPLKKCDLCTTNCKRCTNNQDCSECLDGYFLDISEVTPGGVKQYKCDLTCPVGKFALPSGLCENCKANCKYCKDTLTCETCNVGYYLLQDISECRPPVAVGVQCPGGYYFNQTTTYC